MKLACLLDFSFRKLQKLLEEAPSQHQKCVYREVVSDRPFNKHFGRSILTPLRIYFHLFITFVVCLLFCVCPAASYGAYPICKGCSVCSRDNGCVNCQPKLFLFLRRERMRQYGECLHDCPAGYYGMRSPELNMCSSKYSQL